MVFKVFGGPRPSKTASEDPGRVPRGYVRLFGGGLSHLGAILETRAFKIAPASWDCCRGSPRWPILGSISGSKIGLFLWFSGVIFWTSFDTIFGYFGSVVVFVDRHLNTFWSPFWGPTFS